MDRQDDFERGVSNRRAVLGDDPSAPRYIETVYGVGYRFKRA